MSKLLLNEEPLLIMPGLAIKIGLNESIILQQFHYWLNINKKTNKNLKDGYYWTYNTYKEWQEQFPFWSISTIKRTVYKLEKLGLVISTDKFNKLQIDKTKWYTIDYAVLEIIENTPTVQNDTSIKNKVKNTSFQNETSQNEPSNVSDWNVQRVGLNRALPEITTETSPKTNSVVVEAYTNSKGKSPTKAEKDKLIELSNSYSTELILKAIDMTVEQAEHFNLKYIRTILSKWKAKGLNTLEEVEKSLESDNKAKQDGKEPNKKKNVKENTTTNSFTNRKQATYDIAAIEKSIRGW